LLRACGGHTASPASVHHRQRPTAWLGSEDSNSQMLFRKRYHLNIQRTPLALQNILGSEIFRGSSLPPGWAAQHQEGLAVRGHCFLNPSSNLCSTARLANRARARARACARHGRAARPGRRKTPRGSHRSTALCVDRPAAISVTISESANASRRRCGNGIWIGSLVSSTPCKARTSTFHLSRGDENRKSCHCSSP